MSDPLLPHLLDIMSSPDAADGLILAGGYGLRVKQRSVLERATQTLLGDVPGARATTDLDFFLRLQCFIRPEQGSSIRAHLDWLGYAELVPKMQFDKPLFAGSPVPRLKVDLLARLPEEAEAGHVRVRRPRVGAGSPANLHAHAAPEAFAVEDEPDHVHVHGRRTDGSEVAATVAIPNAYAWLNLKVAAARDDLESPGAGATQSESRHALDVYLLIAMLAEDELARSRVLRARYERHPHAQAPREAARRLFGSASAAGSRAIRLALRQSGSVDYRHEVFAAALRDVMG